MTWLLPRVWALSTSGQGDPGVVIAGSRAGALGLLDFGLGFEAAAVLAAARRASAFLKGRSFGLRVPAGALGELALDAMPDDLGVVLVAEDGDVDWGRAGELVRRAGRVAVAEVTSRKSAWAASASGFAGLVVAGNEAGGRGGDEGSLILLQAVLAGDGPPVWVRGGIGPRSASACVAAGAAGVVLDGALLLARESAVPASVRERVARWDGGETVVVGRGTGMPVRVQADPGSPALARLREAAGSGQAAWDLALRREVGWGEGQARPAGQDAALAAGLARRFVTVGGIVQEVERAIDEGLRDAEASRPLAQGSALARSHGTAYPIVQGPMTRVSDSVAFASSVAEGGALPFLALAMMRGSEIRPLLDAAADRLEGRAWGVGILGFVSPELRREQIDEIRRVRPPFALIAGGRPDQAADLERSGIATYLHAPSPGLLRQYWNDGARRFVLEGRECGGHVGPRSSLVLWEQGVQLLLEALGSGGRADDLHLLFAGGIHDDRSAAAVAALAAPLARRGAKVGVLIGTAYLFTAEAVATGAIVPGFQDEALRCSETVLLETGPGHEVRVSPTPFAEAFEQERRRLQAEGRTAEEIRVALEGLNVGRLRIAAKGVDRSEGAGSRLVALEGDDQKARGLYMLGQVATLRGRVTTIAELHREISDGATARIARLAAEAPRAEVEPAPAPSDIAIVGMSAIVPGAADVRTFWENTLRGHDAITEVPADRWDWRLYYDADPKAPDKIISKWGGFVPEVAFDPLRYGMPPASLPQIEPLHLLTLEAVRSALDDAGYRDRPFPRERTAVVLGAGGGAAQTAMGYAFRSYLPLLDTVLPGVGREALERCGGLLPEWTEDSFAGILLNVAAGRVANRFDLGGANYTVDAACGSSLAAAAVAVRELETGAADMVILGGADTVQNPFTYLAFSKTQAFSPRGRCRPFDASADGIVISEAVAVVVLKRLADAERDGDKIYAVIKGLGASSDGRAKGLTAPRPEGQVRALERAYAKAGVSPATVGYVEAHGTGTAAGDLSEVQALSRVFAESGAGRGRCALGSVKSQIGHTKCAAGLAGLINAALALHHRVLPPTIGVVEPSPAAHFDESPFHISATTRPWLHADPDRPRRAGVSAFGFGGTNFHAVLEAYDGSPAAAASPVRDWPAELLVWRAGDRRAILADVDSLARALDGGARPALRDLARTLSASLAPAGPSLAIVATSLDDLRGKLARARAALEGSSARLHDPTGIDFCESPAELGGRLAFLFPGQGAQRPGMLNDLALMFPEVRGAFDEVDARLAALGRDPIGPLVFPPHAFSEADRERQKRALADPAAAQPALGAASVGLLRLLEAIGVVPDVVAGHSYGELVALHAAGSLSLEALVDLSEARGRLLQAAAAEQPGAMAALSAGPDRVARLLDGVADVEAVNWNGPSQTVISGGTEAVDQVLAKARRDGLRGQRLAVAGAFHSKRVAGASRPLAERVRGLMPSTPRRPVYSNVDAATYPAESDAIAERVGAHVARPVRFAPMIEAMHADGARIFIEVGPGSTLSSLVGSILGHRPFLAVACDPSGRPGVAGLLPALARLFVAGVPLRLERLTEGRAARVLDRERFEAAPDREPITASTWLVNGTRARPAGAPEPKRLGPGPALPGPEPILTPTIPTPKPQAAPMPTPSTNGKHAHAATPSTNGHAHGVPAPDRGADRVLEAFQKTMQTFLEVQRETMLGFLAGRDLAPAPSDVPFGPEHLAVKTISNGHPHPPAPELEPKVARIEPPVEVVAPPLPTPVAPPSPKAEAQAPLGREEIAARLLAIVRDRTGYPAEMLRLDLDLEADLGIDSIKRVEILGSLRDALPIPGLGSSSEMMDQLSRARTLGAIVERVEAAAAPTPTRAASPAAEPPRVLANGLNGSAPHPIEADDGSVRRMVLETVEAPLPTSLVEPGLARGGVVLVTDDQRGIARALAADLRAQGHPVVRIVHDPSAATTWEGDCVTADLTSPGAVHDLVGRVRGRGPLAGVVHLLPLRDRAAAGLDAEDWASRMAPEVRGLFLLARAAAEDLERSARRGGACLIACTAMGGAFASAGHLPRDFFPGHGAVAGLVKTLGREWPRAIRTRVIDLDPLEEVELLAANLVHEVGAEDGRCEVGYLDRRRVALKVVENDLAGARRGAGVALEPGEPLLMTGGARGITAVVAADLARRWRPTLLLVGTSPLPRGEESPLTAGVTCPATLKSLLHQGMARDPKAIGPAELERAYQSLRRQREIRANLEVLRASASAVEYAQVDVRDAEALRQTIGRWRERYGPIRGLVHGAGVIQDKLLRDKSLESFDRVLGTKVEGALNLAALLDRDPLRFAAFFSSVAGRFGNRGQADYAAANETLNKLALWLDRRWAGRVVSVIWGPWSGVGMVSEIEGHLGRRGLGMIPPGPGARRLGDELALGRKGDVEVVVAGEIGPLLDTEETSAPAPPKHEPAARVREAFAR